MGGAIILIGVVAPVVLSVVWALLVASWVYWMSIVDGSGWWR